MAPRDPLLVLTPLKDAAPFLDGYFARLASLRWPADALSLGLLEGDSRDDSWARAQSLAASHRRRFAEVTVTQRHFGFPTPAGVARHAGQIQPMRRAVLARARNHLLFAALRPHHRWVLWLDVDVIAYPDDIVDTLLAAGGRIVHPNCVLDPGGPSFDRNAWTDRGEKHLSDHRGRGRVRLDSVGGTMLLVDADLHRDGLVFPPFAYGAANARVRPGRKGEVETEGLGLLAHDLGAQPWGCPTSRSCTRVTERASGPRAR